MRMFKFVILVGCVLLSQSCGKAPEAKHETLTISINSWVGFGPLFVAKERRFFGDMDVQIVQIDDSAARRANLSNGGSQILGSTIDDLAVINRLPKQAVAVGCADYSNGADGILGGGSVKTLAQLATAEVAVDRGFVNHFFLLYVLDKNGFKLDKIRLAQMKPDDAGIAFSAGKIDAAVTWEPSISNALKTRKGSVLLASTKQYPEALVDLFVGNKEWVQTHPEMVRKFREGWDRAVKFTRSNPEEAYAIMHRNMPAVPQDQIGGIFQDVGLLTGDECRSTIGPKWPELSSAAVRLWRQAGLLDKDVDLSNSLVLN